MSVRRIRIAIDPLDIAALKMLSEQEKKRIIEAALLLPKGSYDKYVLLMIVIFSAVHAAFFDASCISLLSSAIALKSNSLILEFLCYSALMFLFMLIAVNVILQALVRRRL